MKDNNSSLRHLSLAGSAAILLGSCFAHADTRTWDAANATSSSWALGSNWVGGIAPVNGDDVVVSAGGTFSPADYHGVEANSLTLTGSTTLSLTGLKVGAGGVTNSMATNSLFLYGTTTLLANQTWSGTRTIFVENAEGDFKVDFNGSSARFDGNSPNWTGGLDVRTSVNMGAGSAGAFGPGAITPYGTGTITLINRRSDGSTASNPSLGFSGNATNNSMANAQVIANNITLSTPGSNANNFTITQSNDATSSVPHFYELSGNITGAVSNSRTLNFTNTHSSAAGTPATFILTGTNSYAAATSIGTNATVVFASTAAKASGTVTASSASSSIGLGVGGAGYYTAANVGSLFNTNNLTGFSLASGSGVAIDTSNAGGSFNQTTALTAARSLTKLGTGTLVMSQTNTYSGATNVGQGTMSVTGSINGTSGITVAPGAKFLYNSSTALTKPITLNGDGSANRAVLGGTGKIDSAVTLDNLGDVLSPGNSPGIQEFTVGQNLSSFTYDWEVNDFTGTSAGTAFDQITIAGALTLNSANAYALNLLSLTGLVTGDAVNFSEINRSWNILTTTSGISGFNTANWAINPVGFSNGESGTWSLAETNGNLILSYTAVPESRTALLCGLGLLVLLRRRRS